MQYIVLEIKEDKNGEVTNIVNVYPDKQEAEVRFHQILMYAAASGNEMNHHNAVMITSNGEWEKSDGYDHTV